MNQSTSAPSSTSTLPRTLPRIGQYWTGEGGVFAGMGRGHDGMPDHCLIIPIDPLTCFVGRSLGTYGVDVQGACSDHNGMANTIALAEAGSTLCQEALAVQIEGHKDFYLLSPNDAHLCWANVPELFEKKWHLTSKQYDADYAFFQDFDDGDTYVDYKEFEACARLARRLVL